MTEALYMSDCYLKEFYTAVAEVAGNAIVLDKTAFYPAGGGVPCDTGWVAKGEEKFEVSSVTKEAGRILHHLSDNHSIAIGDKVSGLIDWNRRYMLMRQHTSAHLLAAIMYNQLGVLITGNQLGTDQSRMDFSLENFDRALIESVFQKANEEIQNDKQVRIYFLNRNDAMKIPGVVKLASALPPNVEELRIVEIEDIDVQADGGCHVKSLKEIGRIEFLKAENKGKNNRRVYYTVRDE